MTLHTKGNKDYIIQLSSCSYDVEHPELFLKVINYIIVQLESLNKNIRIDGRIRSKDYVCYGNHPRILTAETGKGNSIGLPNVELEVNKANWEYKHIYLI